MNDLMFSDEVELNKINFLLDFKGNLLGSSEKKSKPMELGVYSREGKPLYSHEVSYEYKDRSTLQASVPAQIVAQKFEDERFYNDYKLVKEQILHGSLEKGVVYNTLEIEFDSSVDQQFFLPNLLPQKTNQNYFSVWDNYNNGFASLSPELLFKKDDFQYSIDAIAGTELNPDDLMEYKNQIEQNYVVEDIVTKLSQMQIGFQVNEREVIQFKNYFHLKSEINFKTKTPESEIIRRVAPTAAIGGYPSSYFSHLKQELEFENISQADTYAGIFHFKTDDLNVAIVGIRSLSWSGNKAYIHAGCGVVKESNFDRELKESHMKINSVLRSFNYEIA